MVDEKGAKNRSCETRDVKQRKLSNRSPSKRENLHPLCGGKKKICHGKARGKSAPVRARRVKRMSLGEKAEISYLDRRGERGFGGKRKKIIRGVVENP